MLLLWFIISLLGQVISVNSHLFKNNLKPFAWLQRQNLIERMNELHSHLLNKAPSTLNRVYQVDTNTKKQIRSPSAAPSRATNFVFAVKPAPAPVYRNYFAGIRGRRANVPVMSVCSVGGFQLGPRRMIPGEVLPFLTRGERERGARAYRRANYYYLSGEVGGACLSGVRSKPLLLLLLCVCVCGLMGSEL